jgi:hypothetical protein
MNIVKGAFMLKAIEGEKDRNKYIYCEKLNDNADMRKFILICILMLTYSTLTVM